MYSKLIANKEAVQEKYDVRIFVLDESKCSELMLSNRVKAALLNPIAYGRGVKTADYRIIPAPGLAGFYYTGLASIIFKEGLKKVETLATALPESFIAQIGLRLLLENYGMDPKIIVPDKPDSKTLPDADASIILENTSGAETGLDITEEWYMFSELALPIGMWVCRSEEYPPNIQELVKELAEDPAQQEEIVSEIKPGSNTDEIRTGKIIRHWNDEFESGLEFMLRFLYYSQYIPEIAGIKVLGRDQVVPSVKSIQLK